ncbi:MAG: uroporphyrinogen-III synthase [Anaerolineae bacterium]|jgi:uroporphyrinogen III methyltransferase/synthase|nr:uroporphyrinogen-III synthase [Anaerolineae bacterium]MBT4312676.1 uroporphyrinogen-III synthase [Anaerolineae bacterium]MBT4458593.1 uroporphyrinogen-III synthase [Anaerolineae bacterium]MBT4843353.1 uroporphyrinogen-III synthase [Anaerolineae bacterium]MBT6061472.1 uroporphyrinogen-III synthase [Anaerolineae bacterium]
MSKVLITRPRKQSQSFADALRRAGFEPIFFPIIQIRPMKDLSALDEAMAQIVSYEWIIFSSTNAVDVFFDFVVGVQHAAPLQRPRWPKIAAIGSKTEASLRSRGVVVDFIPEEYIGEAILPGLGGIQDKWILLPRAKAAREVVPREITKAGGIVHEIAIYETVTAEPTPTEWDALRAGVDVVTFTSPSTVTNFVKLTKAAEINPFNLTGNPVFACIGPITEKAAKKAGFSPIVVAETYTTDGLIDTLCKKL